jgi:hypothetical protein
MWRCIGMCLLGLPVDVGPMYEEKKCLTFTDFVFDYQLHTCEFVMEFLVLLVGYYLPQLQEKFCIFGYFIIYSLE